MILKFLNCCLTSQFCSFSRQLNSFLIESIFLYWTKIYLLFEKILEKLVNFGVFPLLGLFDQHCDMIVFLQISKLA